MAEIDLMEAHKHSSHHREEILASAICGCFYCLETYGASEVTDWIVHDTCALCPRCEIDSVIGDASGLPVADRSFLFAMHERWFGGLPIPSAKGASVG